MVKKLFFQSDIFIDFLEAQSIELLHWFTFLISLGDMIFREETDGVSLPPLKVEKGQHYNK